MESKGAKECNETVSKYYERINDTKQNGAIMFAVCRGKISEGIDFADNNGRAVILTGLPFPLYTDPRVMLKRQYLDENKTVKLPTIQIVIVFSKSVYSSSRVAAHGTISKRIERLTKQSVVLFDIRTTTVR